MSYIHHLHAFYYHARRDDRLSATHVSLYLAVFQFWNFNRFQNPFRVNREELMQLSKIGSKNTYHRCIKDLHHAGYIQYNPPLTKFLPAKISMVRFELKEEPTDHKQLDLFGSKQTESSDSKTSITTEENLLPEAGDGGEDLSDENDAPTCISIDTHDGTKNGSHACTESDAVCVPVLTATSTKNGTLACTEFDTVGVPVLTATGIKSDTVPVPFLGHLLKHKQINSKHVCVKNTPTKIFESNKKIENAISKPFGINGSKEEKKQQAGGAPNPVLAEGKKLLHAGGGTALSLSLVENYFLENSFPIAEAQKFFYYNQGRGWMLADGLPVKDWHALAQKWMLNNSNPKFINHDKQCTGRHLPPDPGPGKDYSEPL